MTKLSLTPAEEMVLRSIGSVVLFAVLGWLATNAAQLAPIVGVSGSAFIALIANAIDSAYSPNGTVLAGSIGYPSR